jgi:hypothetical protein
VEKLRWYAMRWRVEQILLLLKVEAVDITASCFPEPGPLAKLAAIAMIAAVMLHHLLCAREGRVDQAVGDAFISE